MNEYVNAINIEVKPGSELHAAALAYAKAGIPIFPCISNAEGLLLADPKQRKKPACKHGYLDATTDLRQIDTWWSENPDRNIGTCPNNTGHAVLDVEKSGRHDWWALWETHDYDVNTREIETPNGGVHLWFKGSLPSTVKKLWPGKDIDTRGIGGYVLLPPSVVNGKRYVLTKDIEPQRLTTWIAGAALELEKRHEPSPARGEPVSLEHLEDVLTFIDPDCDRGTWRNIVAAVLNTNVPPDEDESKRRELAHRWSAGGLWKGKVPSKYTGPDDVDAVLDSMPPKIDGVGYGTIDYHARRAGFDGPSAAPAKAMTEAFAHVEDAREIAEPGRYRHVDLEKAATGPDPEYHDDDDGRGRGIMPDYPEGAVVYFYAASSQHKTGCALREALEAFKRGKNVLFVEGEGTYQLLRMRLPMLCREMGLELGQLTRGGEGLGRFAVIDEVPPLLVEQEVQEFIKAQPWKPDIVFIDTLSDAIPGSDESAAAVSSAVTKAARFLKRTFKALVVIIHHTGKDETKRMRGGSGFERGADGVVKFTYDEAAKTVMAEVEKMRDGPAHFTKGFRVKFVRYKKQHKKTGATITLEVPIVERIPDEQWAAECAAKGRREGVREVVDHTVPAGIDKDKFLRRVFEALRTLDAQDRAAGKPACERWLSDIATAIHPYVQGTDYDEWDRAVEATKRRLQDRLSKCEGKAGPLSELAVMVDGLVRRNPYALLLPEKYREPLPEI